ncbi:MAG TPA: GH92 family glycosyl hydrolase [Jatrophihabitans sp.]|nr:GH92 family glycosyl hydrolase [Jatrophihabitans sp.]
MSGHSRTRSRALLAAVAGAALTASVLSVFTMPAASAAPVGGSFATSFESSDPAALSSTVEYRGKNRPIQSGVAGISAHLPGSVISSSTPISASAENPPAEIASNLADGDASTKWLAFQASATLTYHLPAPAKVDTYALTSANDAPERDPAGWTLAGSTDGTTWTTLDTRGGQSWTARQTQNKYTVPAASVGSFSYYRLAIAAPQSGSLLQLADWDLAVTSTAGSAEPMVTATGNGPTSGLNIKQRAGFTGMHAYSYAGQQTVTGHAYETNVIQSGLNIKVGPQTRLSYVILPQFTAANLDYPSTYAAIDLHFTDGSYLSQLSPLDQHGVDFTARGQGLGKILYADQWNYESSDIGTWASGKTIDRILLAYDDPKAKAGAQFGGWVDDVKIDPAPAQVDASTLTNVVDTRRGTNASGSFSRGNTLPISAVPNGFTFFSPVTDATSQSWEYYYQQANDAQNNPELQGISISHEPSPWMGDRNQLSVMPSIATAVTGSPTGRALAFTHNDEIARPDYYSVSFGNGIRAELTPTDHGGELRFTFPANANHTGTLIFDTVDNNGSFVLDPARGTLSGWVDNGSGLSVGRSRMFFAGTFSALPTATGAAPGGHTGTSFATFDTAASATVTLQLATSFIGLAQAQHNAALELAGKSFDQVHAEATAAWQSRLGVVSVSGETDTQRETLYSNLYRLNLYPNSQFENTGTATAPVYKYASPVADPNATATATTTGAKVMAGKVYVNNGFWDTYRTVWPAYSLLYPDVAAQLIDGFVQQYRDGGWIARWSSPGYADLMTGTSSDVAFAGAYLRGVPERDPLATYDAALKNATVLPTNSGVGRKGLATSEFEKYTDTGTGESVSWALEGDINDEGLSQMAAALAKDPRTPKARVQELKDEAAYFADRAGQYVNLFDPAIGFFQGRNADGSFNQTAAQYDPESWGGVYTETDGWNFAFHAPQDGQGLADLYGGRAALEKKLDQFFATPEKADKPGGYGGVIHEMVEARAVRMGQFGMSNQPSHHIPYMYDYVGAPQKTQALVRQVMQRLYVGDEIGQGYTGDEDNGEMSSWYILSSLGIYPLQSGSKNWAIGSPLFPHVVVHRSSGDLPIDAKNNSTANVYIQSLKVDGRTHHSTNLTTADLAGNAHLVFTMGSSPSSWGTARADAPPSPTTGAKAPTPNQDATSAGVGTLTASNGQDVSALTDNNSTTQTTFTGAVPVLTWTSNGSSMKVNSYTITSGSAPGDPSGWTLEASNNGRKWVTVDRRTDETFRWRVQTRPFTVAKPGSYRQYRLIFTTAPGQTTSLAELELLVKPGSSGTNKLAVTPTSAALSGRTGADISATLATFGGAKKSSAADYSASIDWGDGASSAGSIVAGQLDSYAVRGDHSFAKPGYYRVLVSVSDGQRTATAAVGVTVSVSATGGITSGFDSTCIGDDGSRAADCDAGGYGLSRQALQAAGVTQGVRATVAGSSVDGKALTFVLPAVAPGSADNAKGSGQTVPVSLPADATRIAFIGTGTEGNQSATATLNYTDGTTATVPMNFPDWTLGGGGVPVPAGFTPVAAMAYRLNGTATDSARPYLFAAAPIPLAAGKTLAGVTMPAQTGSEKDAGRVHLFAIADDGTPAPALTATPAADASVRVGTAATLPLAHAAGGAGVRVARVQWGDDSLTEDATLSASQSGSTVSGSHTWTKPGSYLVHVTVSDENSSVTVALTVTVGTAAQAVIRAGAAAPGAAVPVTGAGFAPRQRVTLAFAGQTRVVSADATGRLRATVRIPAGVVGGEAFPVTVTAPGSLPAGTTVVVPDRRVTARVKPTMVLSSADGMTGEQVSVSGTGYLPNESVLITIGGNRLASVRANGDGVYQASFTVPARLGGAVVAATGTSSGIVASSPFRLSARPHGSG